MASAAPIKPLRRYEQVAAYARRIHDERGTSPSYREIRDALGISDDGTVRRYVHQAEAAKLLRLGTYFGGNGTDRQPRIRFGTSDEADTVRIAMGKEAG